MTLVHDPACTHLATHTRPSSLCSIPLAVRRVQVGASGEWRQAEPVRSAYYHRLAANLQGQTGLRFLSDASAGLD